MQTLLDFFEAFPAWLTAITSVVTAATAITALTPTKVDDQYISILLRGQRPGGQRGEEQERRRRVTKGVMRATNVSFGRRYGPLADISWLRYVGDCAGENARGLGNGQRKDSRAVRPLEWAG